MEGWYAGGFRVSLLKMMSVAVLLLCSLHVTAVTTDEAISRCELCNRVGIEQNDKEMIDRC
jgi:hypothetical protein